MKLLEIALLFYLEYKWKCKTIIKNDQHKKYAAIDIGSNAMRLLIVNIVEQEGKEPQFNKSSLVRPYPFRAGRLYCWRNLRRKY
jgi:hypothetical protein